MRGGNMGLLFENETCSRCGGSGNYSYCATHGTRCFKCHGLKVVLTKRGAVAQRYLVELQTVAMKDLKAGQVIECTGVLNGGGLYSYKAPIVSIEPSDSVKHVSSNTNGVQNETVEYIHIKTIHPKFGAGGLHTPQNGRLEERRVGKECISRWSPYH